MEEALARIRTNSPSVAVTVSSTAAFLNLWLVPRLAEIQATLPDIQLRLHASDTAEKLRRGGIDVAIRYGPGPFPGVPSEMLRRDIFKVICSPSIAISSFDGLQNVPLIHVDGRQRPSVAPDWDRWCSLFDIAGVDPTQGIRFPDSMLAVQAAVAGHGVAIVSEVLVGGLIASGLLVSPFEEGIAGDAYHFACAEELQEDTSIAALRRWFAGALA
jgi:LysR family glycine cleavage system transcriptional activator